ncbi:host attachment protein [Aestuariivita boseongensis]|uniref:host attachment protein n=1 Tax=Aestuariivita boseongensis TaxID=1470562 RepID=UPI00067FD6B9|nr:host attachment protein [Aestuariivita boseongensis]
MKPVVTWILVANARSAKVFAHHGPGKHLTIVSDQNWSAPEPRLPDDEAGIGHSIGGPGRAAVEQTNLQDVDDARFAETVISGITKAQSASRFDRLILVAGPHMLGLLRAQMGDGLRAAVISEVAKDLSHHTTESVELHLDDVIAI